MRTKKTPHNIGLAIVGLTVVNLTFVILMNICAKVGLTFFKCPTIAKPKTVSGQAKKTHRKKTLSFPDSKITV
jgi:hypothetical protein